MRLLLDNPTLELERVFSAIARSRMAGLPICNSRLEVEAVGFQLCEHGHWVGVLVTPWAINLLRLPAQPESWPEIAAGGKFVWQFPSGDYEFIVAEETDLGRYHLCSLFSPAQEFATHQEARLVALAAMSALFAVPKALDALPETADFQSRRRFLGIGN